MTLWRFKLASVLQWTKVDWNQLQSTTIKKNESVIFNWLKWLCVHIEDMTKNEHIMRIGGHFWWQDTFSIKSISIIRIHSSYGLNRFYLTLQFDLYFFDCSVLYEYFEHMVNSTNSIRFLSIKNQPNFASKQLTDYAATTRTFHFCTQNVCVYYNHVHSAHTLEDEMWPMCVRCYSNKHKFFNWINILCFWLLHSLFV